SGSSRQDPGRPVALPLLSLSWSAVPAGDRRGGRAARRSRVYNKGSEVTMSQEPGRSGRRRTARSLIQDFLHGPVTQTETADRPERQPERQLADTAAALG